MCAQPTTDVSELIQRAGRAAYPEVALAPATVAELLAGRAVEPASEERAAEVYLALACVAGDATALELIDRRHLAEVRRSLVRGRSPELVGEAIQQLRATIFLPRAGRLPELADFGGAGPLTGWLKTTACSVLVRLEQKGRRPPPVHVPTPAPENPEVAYLQRRYSAALQDALTDAWSDLPAETRFLLRLRYNENLGIDQIAAMENVHRATTARRLNRAERSLIDGARRLLRERLGGTDGDITSMLRMIRSKIELVADAIFA